MGLGLIRAILVYDLESFAWEDRNSDVVAFSNLTSPGPAVLLRQGVRSARPFHRLAGLIKARVICRPTAQHPLSRTAGCVIGITRGFEASKTAISLDTAGLKA